MSSFAGKIAVVTGGGTGMGRELCRALAREGAHVAMCDVVEDNMLETLALCEAEAAEGTRVTTFVADVSDEDAMNAFRDAVAAQHDTDHIHLLFNNAGIGGGGSFAAGERDLWEKTFGVCWYGVYYGARAFLPMLVNGPGGHLVNTSSVNGFWASIGPGIPHTAYSAAKFAVKGFTEALMTDLEVNAPHVQAHLVMPGHIGTNIAINSGKILGTAPEDLSAEDIQATRELMVSRGLPVSNETDDHIRDMLRQQGEDFRNNAPMSAADAAAYIIDRVKAGDWRILVGDDAKKLDAAVRQTPADAYKVEFLARLANDGVFEKLNEAVQGLTD
ncbi:MAG: SDR family NAD(P)-dependent oxidoreductase [Pseudomonadota bacterium]